MNLGGLMRRQGLRTRGEVAKSASAALAGPGSSMEP